MDMDEMELPPSPRVKDMRLFEATVNGDLDAVRKLIEEGLQVDGRDEGDRTPLMYAVIQGYRDIVELLLDSGADVNAWEKHNGLSSLDVAVLEEHGDLVGLLLDRGADVNAKNKRGTTALMLAAYKGFSGIVEILLRRGAETGMRDFMNNTALDLARKQGHMEVAALIEKAGAGS